MDLSRCTLLLLDNQVDIIELCTVTDADGDAYYLYLKIPPSKYEEFRRERDAGTLVLEDYGEVLIYGLGEAPPEDVRRRVEECYGLDHDLEESCLKELL